MTLVPAGEYYPPRIGPKVFADVPSAAELADARAHAAEVKRSRAVLLLLVFLLLGALVATIAFFVMTRDSAPGDVQALRQQVARQAEELRTASAELTRVQGEAARLGAAFDIYRPLFNLETELGDMQAEISAKIEDPVYGALRLSDAERALVYNTAPWPVTGLNAAAWKVQIQQRLSGQIDALGPVQRKVEQYIPPSGSAATPRPVCNKLTDPNCN